MFFFVLLGACVGIQYGVLNPVPPSGTLSFLQTAKTNPRALIKMLQGADKDTVESIIKLLNQLRDDSITEQKRLTSLLADAKKDLAEAQSLLKTLKEKLVAAEIVMNDKRKIFNFADGKWTEVQREHDAESPGLKNEIQIFQKVLVILNGLLAGQPQQKALLDLGTSVEAQQYQKLIENAKADPEKLRKIIDLIKTLLAQSIQELKELDTKLREATEERITAKNDQIRAEGVYGQARAAVTGQETVVSEAEGQLEEAEKEYNTRYPEVTTERTTLEEVIVMLEKMLADQEKEKKQ